MKTLLDLPIIVICSFCFYQRNNDTPGAGGIGVQSTQQEATQTEATAALAVGRSYGSSNENSKHDTVQRLQRQGAAAAKAAKNTQQQK